MSSGDFMLAELILLVAFGLVGGIAISTGIAMRLSVEKLLKAGQSFPGICYIPWTMVGLGVLLLVIGVIRAIDTSTVIKGLLP